MINNQNYIKYKSYFYFSLIKLRLKIIKRIIESNKNENKLFIYLLK